MKVAVVVLVPQKGDHGHDPENEIEIGVIEIGIVVAAEAAKLDVIGPRGQRVVNEVAKIGDPGVGNAIDPGETKKRFYLVLLCLTIIYLLV